MFLPYANNKDTDQPAHPRSLISTFVFSCLDSVMSIVSVTKMSSLMLASVAEQAGLNVTWSETPEDRFSCVVAHIYFDHFREGSVIPVFRTYFLETTVTINNQVSIQI